MAHRTLRFGEAAYPPLLTAAKAPPEALYVDGNADCLLGPCVTVVGTRRATEPGRSAAWAAGGALAGLGVCVISGLAVGCDGEAHGGALAAGGLTAAVLAHGLDQRVYPAEHQVLAGDIVGGMGALVTEYGPGTTPAPWRFVARDAIQAALGLAVVLVESDETGGSFHAVKAAHGLGRPVFAIASYDERFKAAGARRAVAEFGARLIRSSGELRAAIGPLVDAWKSGVGR